jgi:aminoglycoside phosphotransferase (APT) family kinase protein
MDQSSTALDHVLDLAALERYLRQHVVDLRGPLHAERFAGGQSNPTYLIRGGDTRYVLRKKPGGPLLPSAHAVEREYRVISALAHTDVPVPHAYLLCEDPAVIGTPFYLMSYVPGRIFWDPTLPELSRSDRTALYDDINRVVSALHRVDVDGVGLGDFGRSGQYLQRQIGRWSKQYMASRTAPIEALERLMTWLPDRVPREESVAIVHGDLRVDNMIVHPAEPRVIAVLDWEISTLGDPLADLSYHMLTWSLRPDEFRGMVGADLAELGIPSADEYLARYCERTGRAPIAREIWDFYAVYNLFRLAAILQGIAKRAQDGTAASASARELGAKAGPIAEIGWRWAQERLGAR